MFKQKFFFVNSREKNLKKSNFAIFYKKMSAKKFEKITPKRKFTEKKFKEKKISRKNKLNFLLKNVREKKTFSQFSVKKCP